MAYYNSSKSSFKLASPVLFFIFSVIFTLFFFFVLPNHALNVGLHAGADLKLFKECSRKCESKFCEAPPFLRYGKYCGILYSGCPGEQPCDQLDACCMRHDQCIARKGNDYLSQECNNGFKYCMERFRKSGAPSFKGNTCDVDTVVQVLTDVMDAAILAGKVFGKP